jgi:hypothetical protein
MNDTRLFASHSTSGGGFQPGAIEHAAPSLAGMAITNAQIANAALFLFTNFPPGLVLQHQIYLARGANVVLFWFTIVPARSTRLPLVTTRNSAPSRFRAVLGKAE